MTINFLLLGILAVLVYVLAQELVDKGWAFLAVFLTVLNPYFLLNNPLTALAFFVALFSFLELLSRPSKLKISIAGLALGGAQLATEQAWILWLYFFVTMAVFYLLSVVRDWQVTVIKERRSRFQVRAFKYFRSLLIIFIIGTVVFYLGHLFYNSFDLQITNEKFFSFYNFKTALTSPAQIVTGLEYSWPTVALTIAALIFFLLGLSRYLKNDDMIQLLNSCFPELALLIFTILHFYFFKNIGTISPVIYLLITAPLKNFITTKNKKEVVIVIAHEIFSFSAKWLILTSLLFWYLVNSFYYYLR